MIHAFGEEPARENHSRQMRLIAITGREGYVSKTSLPVCNEATRALKAKNSRRRLGGHAD